MDHQVIDKAAAAAAVWLVSGWSCYGSGSLLAAVSWVVVTLWLRLMAPVCPATTLPLNHFARARAGRDRQAEELQLLTVTRHSNHHHRFSHAPEAANHPPPLPFSCCTVPPPNQSTLDGLCAALFIFSSPPSSSFSLSLMFSL